MIDEIPDTIRRVDRELADEMTDGIWRVIKCAQDLRDCTCKLGGERCSIVDERVSARQATLIAEHSSSPYPAMCHDTGVAVDAWYLARGRAWHHGSREAAGRIAIYRLAS